MDYKRYLTPWNIIIIGILLYMFFNAGESIGSKFERTLLVMPGILIALSFHEFAHAFSAYKLGDPTPKTQNRLSVNPKDHIDLWGFLALVFIGFGWGKAVEINSANFKKPRRDQLIVSLSGVTMNLVLAVVFSFIYRFFSQATGATVFSGGMLGYAALIIYYVVSINIVLMVFNLLPIPPLDGFSALTEIFDLRRYDWYWKVYGKGMLILLIAIVLGIGEKVLFPSVSAIMGWLSYIGHF